MKLRFHNTRTNSVEDFEPAAPPDVGMYVCGLTVYSRGHIGNFRTLVMTDLLRRVLRHAGFRVKEVMNITDVDDRIIQLAQKAGQDLESFTAPHIRAFEEDLAALHLERPEWLPRATRHIGEMIDLVRRLSERGHTYEADGSIYFRIASFPEYGRLARLDLSGVKAGARVDTDKYEKEDLRDFVLWKSKADEPAWCQWDAPFGRGRPGWHIECSAMSMKYLGETFDIHGGGMDLVFPHHENEIAQSEAATGKPFVNYWMHNGLTRVNTKKMSKSLGNIRLISELLQQFSGEVIRFFILSTHYRRPIDFSDEEITKVAKGIQTFYRLFDRISQITGADIYKSDQNFGDLNPNRLSEPAKKFLGRIEAIRENFIKAMDDDFNTAEAIAALYEMANAANHFIEFGKLSAESAQTEKSALAAGSQLLVLTGRFLGLFEQRPEEKITDRLTDDLMKLLIDVRAEARKQKQFALSDLIRDRLKEIHLQLKDTKDGTTWERIP